MERYAAYKDSGVEWIGEIPEGWEVKKLKYMADARPSNIDKKSKEKEEVVLLCNYVDVYKNEFISSGLAFMTATASQEQKEKFLLQKGDVLATKDSETPDDIAIPALVLEDLNNIVCGYHLTHIKPKKITGSYLFRYFQTKYLRSYFEVSANGVTRYGLGVDKFGSALILNPPLEEQTAIANYLDRKTAEIDALIAQKQRLIELYQEEKTAIINQAVTKGINFEKGNHKGLPLRDSGIDWLGEIPDGWEVAELRRFIHFITSGSRGWAEHYADEGKIFIRIGNLTRHSIDIDLSDIQYVDPPVGAEGERTRIFEGDVLFSITAYIGSMAVATDAIAGAYINQHIALVRPLMDKVFPRYVAYVALSDLGQSQLSGKGYGGTKVQLALDDVKSLLIPVPPLSEQTAIVHYIKTETARIDAKIAKTQRIIELQQEYRTALISEVVTGKVRVT